MRFTGGGTMDVIPVFECFLCEELRPEGVRIGRVWCCAV